MSAHFESLAMRSPIVPRLIVPWAPPVAEPYRALRERLRSTADGRPLQAIVFAGCHGGEGTTEIVEDFGESLARSGLKVLLVDIEGGRVARAGPTHLMQLVARDERDEGAVLASRAPCHDKEQFYRSEELASWLARQRDCYDYILFAAPPIGRLADGTLLGRLCDGVVIVVAAGATRRQALARVRVQLDRSGVNVVGAVLNRFRDEVPALLRRYVSAA